MSVRLLTAFSMDLASTFECAPGSSSTFVPFANNSGAPHSAASTCANSWHRTLWYDWQREASESEFAAVPLKTKNTSHFVSKTSRIRFEALSVQVSLP